MPTPLTSGRAVAYGLEHVRITLKRSPMVSWSSAQSGWFCVDGRVDHQQVPVRVHRDLVSGFGLAKTAGLRPLACLPASQPPQPGAYETLTVWLSSTAPLGPGSRLARSGPPSASGRGRSGTATGGSGDATTIIPSLRAVPSSLSRGRSGRAACASRSPCVRGGGLHSGLRTGPRPTARRGLGQERVSHLPLGVGQAGRVAAALLEGDLPRMVRFGPHPAYVAS